MVTLVGTWTVSWTRFAPPSASSGGGSASVERMLEHVRALAGAPRPPGSEAHRRARDEIARRLAEVGAEVEVQSEIGWAEDRERATLLAGRVDNVLGILRGRGSAGSVLLTAHYDTVASAPGAADDAAGVAALIEIARVLAQTSSRERDVLFLFTDGEEEGLLGVSAFMSKHPAARTVAVAINLEARGTQGASVLFETGSNNGEWVARWASASPDPVGNSIASEVYRHLPNDTDFSVLKREHVAGYNLAFIEGLGRYHTSADRTESLDTRSLAHQANTALGMARALSTQAELPSGRGDAVFFDVWRLWVIRYPSQIAVALAIAAAILCALAVGMTLARSGVSPVKLAVALAGRLALPAGLVCLYYGIWTATERFVPDAAARLSSWPEHYRCSLLLSSLLGAAYLVWAESLASRWIAEAEHTSSAFIIQALLVLASAVWAPGTSYLFLWPTLLWAALALADLSRQPTSATTPLALLGAAAWALTTSPVVLGLGLALPAPQGFLATVLVAVSLAPIAGTLVRAWRPRRVASAALFVGISTLPVQILLLTWSPIDGAHPYPEHVVYATDVNARSAVWASADPTLGPIASALFKEGVAENSTGPWPIGIQHLAAAPYVELQAPDVLAVTAGPAAREVTVRVSLSPKDRALWVDMGESPATLNAIQNTAVQVRKSWRWVRYRGDSVVDLTLSRDAAGTPFEIRLIAEHAGLPDLGPKGMLHTEGHPPGPDLLSDISLVGLRVRLSD